MRYNIEYVRSGDVLRRLYEESTFSVFGISVEDIPRLVAQLRPFFPAEEVGTVYIAQGSDVNDTFSLPPEQRCPADMQFACVVVPAGVRQIKVWDGKWFDELIDTAKARGRKRPLWKQGRNTEGVAAGGAAR